MALEPLVPLRFVGAEVVGNDMDLAARVLREEAVHEVEELDTAPAAVMAAAHLAGGDVEGGEQRGRAMPFAIVALTGQHPPFGQLQVALERFDRRLS